MSSFNMSLENRIKGVRLQDQGPLWDRFDQSDKDGHDRAEAEGIEEVEQEAWTPSEEELEQIRNEAYTKGYAAGELAGQNAGKEEAQLLLQPKLGLLENIIQSVQEEKEMFFRENELSIVKLAMGISRKIIQQEVNQNPEILLYVVREALRRVTDKQQVVVRVHPTDLKFLQDTGNAFLSDVLKGMKEVEFAASDEIEPGGCVVETENGIVDAQISVQLDRIEQSLMEGANG